MRKVSVVLSLVGMATLTLPSFLWAEHHEEAPPTLSDVWLMEPKAGMEDEFFAAVAADKKFRDDAGDSRQWDVYTVEMGDHMGVVQFRACCFDWAGQDAYDVETKEKGFSDHWNENVHQFVDHYHHHLQQMDFENSHWPEGQEEGPLFGVTTWKVKGGSGPASSDARKKLSQLAIEGGWGSDSNNWLWHWSLSGAPDLMLVSSYENFAAMADPEQSFMDFLSEEIGAEEAAELFKAFNSGLGESDYTVWRHQPELSSARAD